MDRKSVIVTGLSRGIGRAIAIYFAQQGWNIIGTYFREVDEADKTRKSCEGYGVTCSVYQLDLADVTSIDLFCSNIGKEGNIVTIVNNAGFILRSSFPYEVDEHDFLLTLKGHVVGPYQLISYLTNFDKINIKYIVNIGSTAAFRGSPNVVDYSVAKAGVEAMTKSLAKALGPATTVNCILPGFINTSMTANSPSNFIAAQQDRTIMKRLGEPEEVASVAFFLGSGQASYITGQSIIVDGGHWIS